MRDFIFLIGPSAVGKTTLAKELYQHYKGVPTLKHPQQSQDKPCVTDRERDLPRREAEWMQEGNDFCFIDQPWDSITGTPGWKD